MRIFHSRILEQLIVCEPMYTTTSRCYYVYILTNIHKTVYYIGVTNDLKLRLAQHYSQRGNAATFTGRYNVHYLIYFETHQYIINAIAREKELKKWKRQMKMKLIHSMNPTFEFLNYRFYKDWPPKEPPGLKKANFT